MNRQSDDAVGYSIHPHGTDEQSGFDAFSAISPQLSCRNMSGADCTRQFGLLVQHFFNLQTHHRGQVTTLLNQLGLDVGVTDLLALIPDQVD